MDAVVDGRVVAARDVVGADVEDLRDEGAPVAGAEDGALVGRGVDVVAVGVGVSVDGTGGVGDGAGGRDGPAGFVPELTW